MTMRIAIAISTCLLFALPVYANTSAETDFRTAQEKYQSGEYKEAANLLIRAVEQGHEAAQVPLGAMLRAGQGVQQNLPEAFKLFKSAAYQGYPKAQFTVGMMYRLGEGTQTDYGEAEKWFRRAAAVGHAEAQNSLGVMFETGRGVKASFVTAVMWYGVAGSSGSRRGVDNQNELSKKLSAQDVAQAKARALACMRNHYKRCD